ncbi:hypothetical protein EB796_003023 [Bugula neritina]|uniref:Uncharacterized protein n=1 Tax=Bugula neritina TaxID=10212 RepID=A0A7J7ITN6_BUGNE|nr:hypothetical protein EB796_024399 [Bugula neritina]KAF6038668.1 hypothetical protein EB796_003023 [Bugula neritina]
MAGDGVAKFDPKAHVEATKAEWLRKQRVFREMYYSKSKLPPMTIEPFPFERERLPFKMTAEDRALRHQWIQDQVLSKNEPRYIPELHPKNFFRRIYGAPWDYVTKYVTASMGIEKARLFRFMAPKAAMFIAGLCFINDYMKHNESSWEQAKGFNTYSNKLPIYNGEIPENPSRDYREKSGGDFYNRGFTSRTTHKL